MLARRDPAFFRELLQQEGASIEIVTTDSEAKDLLEEGKEGPSH